MQFMHNLLDYNRRLNFIYMIFISIVVVNGVTGNFFSWDVFLLNIFYMASVTLCCPAWVWFTFLKTYFTSISLVRSSFPPNIIERNKNKFVDFMTSSIWPRHSGYWTWDLPHPKRDSRLYLCELSLLKLFEWLWIKYTQRSMMM